MASALFYPAAAGADRTEFVTADKFVPVRFDDSGKPVDVAFLTVKRVGNMTITRKWSVITSRTET